MSNEKQNGCAVCGGLKKFPKSETCSRECSNVIKRGKTYENRVCPVCSTKFEERIKRERRFCSELCRLDWQARPENIAARMERTKEAVMEKYGVESTFLVKEVQEKAANAMRKKIEEHGDERTEKIKATKLDRYGDEGYNNVAQGRETKAQVYGDENYNNREKAAETMLGLYGETHAMKREDFQEKAKATLMKNYGVTNPLQSDEIKHRMKETIYERHGVENVSQVMSSKMKVSETWKKRFKETKQYELFLQLEPHGIELVGEFSGFTNPSYQEGARFIDYDFRCKKCGHEFKRKFCGATVPICRKCYPSPKSPRTHSSLRQALIDGEIAFIENSRRHIPRLELDFVMEKAGLAIEVNGNYFHSERAGGKMENYHLRKTELAHERGIRLIHVFEDEIMYKPHIVLGNIMSALGKFSMNIEATNCAIVELAFEDKRDFLMNNHTHGDSPSSSALGLIHDGVLVSVMTFGPKRKTNEEEEKRLRTFELVRWCDIVGHNVDGAFSVLFNRFLSLNDPLEVTAYVDIGWAGYNPERTMYFKNGFRFESFGRPKHWYFKSNDYMGRYHRHQFRKDVVLEKVVEAGLLEKDAASKLNEWELAQLLGMDRIWDCGNMKFSWSPATK